MSREGQMVTQFFSIESFVLKPSSLNLVYVSESNSKHDAITVHSE